jgi:hypothetical protein
MSHAYPYRDTFVDISCAMREMELGRYEMLQYPSCTSGTVIRQPYLIDDLHAPMTRRVVGIASVDTAAQCAKRYDETCGCWLNAIRQMMSMHLLRSSASRMLLILSNGHSGVCTAVVGSRGWLIDWLVD